MTFPPGKPIAIPTELEAVRVRAGLAVLPIKPAGPTTAAEKKFLFTAKRTDAGRKLPPYYLVYFLLVDLLGFPNLGAFEKLAWSVPIEFDGVAFLIEHRKFGVGVFARDDGQSEAQAEQIVSLIHRGIKAAEPFFKWMANEAVHKSRLNVRNASQNLFRRFKFLRSSFFAAAAEAESLKTVHNAAQRQREFSFQLHSVKDRNQVDTEVLLSMFRHPWSQKSDDARWLALAAIDAFYSWTEHIFIHLAILQSQITTGAEVAEMAGADWGVKFKKAFDVSDKTTKLHFDRLVVIRRQLRNFIAHGAFGKEREAFHFHSGAGAVPVTLDNEKRKPKFSLTPELGFDDAEAIEALDNFVSFLWSGPREPARLYIQESELPLILPHASDGVYKRAMTSVQSMSDYIDHQTAEWDRAANMDW